MSEYGGARIYTRVSVPRREDLTFEWTGPDAVRFQHGNGGLLDFDPYGLLSNHNPQVGDVFDYAGFTMRCTVSDARCVEAVRV